MAGVGGRGKTGPGRSVPVWRAAILPLVGSLILVGTGHRRQAAYSLGVLVAILIVRWVVGPAFDRGLARVIRWILRPVVALVSGVVFLVTVLPMWLARAAFGRHREPPGWQPRTDTSTRGASHPYTWERPAAVGSRRQRALLSLGAIAALVVVDFGVGAAWDRLTDPRPTTDPATTVINLTGRRRGTDGRASDPAFGDAPWVDEYFDDLNSIQFQYWPYVLFRMAPLTSRYVNVDGWTRRSYTSDGATDGPRLAFYGGSTTFGVGQRDDHTIASEVARLAEADGIPVQVENHGMDSWVNYQEALLFSQLEADGADTDIAVFYDGVNDVLSQRLEATQGHPTDIAAGAIGQALVDYAQQDDTDSLDVVPLAGPQPEGRSDSVWDAYIRHSATAKVLRRVRTLIDEPAGAAASSAAAGQASSEPDPATVGAAAAKVYGEGLDIIEDRAARDGVEVFAFWQPVSKRTDEDGAYAAATDLLDPRSTSIAGCLDDHPEVFLETDPFHTNEAGAKLVARCMWSHLEPAVRAWYDDH